MSVQKMLHAAFHVGSSSDHSVFQKSLPSLRQFLCCAVSSIRHHLIKHTFQQTFTAGAPLIAGIYTWPTSPITLSGAAQLINPENISKEEERAFVERREQKHTKCPHQPTPNTLT